MFIIKHIEIEGFWNSSRIMVDLNEDVNIFIGVNGSGKTTFINMLEATLTGDVVRLSTYRFKRIKIQLFENNHKRSIVVEKNEITDNILVKIGTSKFDFPFFSRRDLRSHFYPNSHLNYSLVLLKERLNELLGITYLSVHRNIVRQDSEIIKEEIVNQQNPVDARLTDLMSKLTSYQLQLQSSVNELSKKFQRSILKLMLYNPSYDELQFNSILDIDFDKLRRGLTQAYKDLGLLDEEQKQNINQHLLVIKRASEQINKHINKEEEKLLVNDVTALTLMKRSEKIVELSSILEFERNEIFEPLNKYIDLITHNFILNKELKFYNNNKIDLVFFKGKREFLTSQLSSGEKQLLILFTEALLQKKRKCIFIADEPELSLHISWQRKIIATLKLLNPNAQLILATHSPEIVGPLRNKTINMQDIVYNGE